MELISKLLNEIPASIQAQIVGAAATLFASLLAAIVIFIQIGRQSKNAIRQVKINEAIKLKRDVYKEVVDIAASVQNAETDLFSYSHKFEFDLNAAEASLQFFGNAKVPGVCTEDLNEKHYSLLKSISSFIGLIERWMIIDTRLIVFQVAINVAKFDLDQQYGRYFGIALKTMPRKFQLSSDPAAAIPEWQIPTGEIRKSLEAESAKYRDALMAIGVVVHDFNIEMQNLLLSELFGNHVPYRRPIDPRIKVTKLEEHNSLIDYFENNTAWGHNKRAAEERARASL